MSAHPNGSKQLLPWAAAGREPGREELGIFLHSLQGTLQAIASTEMPALLRAKMEPDDMVQETFLRVLGKFSQFSGTTKGELAAWTLRILRHTLTDLIRGLQTQRKNGPEVSLQANRLTEIAAPLRREAAADFYLKWTEEIANPLTCAFLSLPVRSPLEQVVTLRYDEALSFEEIAHRLGISRTAAYRLWLEALELLKQQVEAHPGYACN